MMTDAEIRTMRAEALTALRDNARDLLFDAASHTYTLRGRELKSVSSVVEGFSRFDAQAAALGCSRNPGHELCGLTVQEILDIWKDRADAASAAGTAVHEYAEALYLLRAGLTECLDEKAARRLDGDGLAPHTGKEAAALAWWRSERASRLVPVARETRIANEALGYAGTFDLLALDPDRGSFTLLDWKTNADIHKSHGGRMRPPFSHLPDDPLGHYALQQSLYALQLRDMGINVGDMHLIWLRDDATFEEIPLRYCGELARRCLSGTLPGNGKKTTAENTKKTENTTKKKQEEHEQEKQDKNHNRQ